MTRPELVLAGIARAVGAELGGTSSLLEALAEQLGDGHWLLVLDNLEQVLQVAGDLQELLARCPGVTILATSRTVMGLGAEQEGLPLAIELAAARTRLLDPGAARPAGPLAGRAGDRHRRPARTPTHPGSHRRLERRPAQGR